MTTVQRSPHRLRVSSTMPRFLAGLVICFASLTACVGEDPDDGSSADSLAAQQRNTDDGSCLADSDCAADESCELETVCPECTTHDPPCLAPCQVKGTCVPPVTCETVRCAAGTHCEMVGGQAECLKDGPRCMGDNECADGLHCNAADICLPPPGCEDGGACPAVCTGYCVAGPCDDGGPLLCDSTPPTCGADEILAVQEGCWACVNPKTCSGETCATVACAPGYAAADLDSDGCDESCVRVCDDSDPNVLCEMIPPDCDDASELVIYNSCWECAPAGSCPTECPYVVDCAPGYVPVDSDNDGCTDSCVPADCSSFTCPDGQVCIDGFAGPVCVDNK